MNPYNERISTTILHAYHTADLVCNITDNCMIMKATEIHVATPDTSLTKSMAFVRLHNMIAGYLVA